MNRMPDLILDRMRGGDNEGAPLETDAEVPLHESSRIESVLARHQTVVGRGALTVLEKLESDKDDLESLEEEIGINPDLCLHLDGRVAELKLHTDADGNLGLTTDLIMATLVAAGRKVKVGRRYLTSAGKRSVSVVPGIVQIHGGDFIPFLSDPPPIWKPFTLPGRAPKKKGVRRKRTEVAITRPRIPHWRLSVDIGFNPRLVAEATVRKVFEVAGSNIGFGDFRPGLASRTTSFGRFGRFTVESWEVLES